MATIVNLNLMLFSIQRKPPILCHIMLNSFLRRDAGCYAKFETAFKFVNVSCVHWTSKPHLCAAKPGSYPTGASVTNGVSYKQYQRSHDLSTFFQINRPPSMKKDGIRTRKRNQKGGAWFKVQSTSKRGRGTGKYNDLFGLQSQRSQIDLFQ